MKKLLSIVFIFTMVFLVACENKQPNENTIEDEPKPLVSPQFINTKKLDIKETSLEVPNWIDDAVMYEVNVRAYTKEGTFNAFKEHLPRLKELGVEILWFMPIHPISMEKRIGSLGSYYAVANYRSINPEFGTLEDFKSLVNEAHKMGFKIVLDMVFNHTGWDHYWFDTNPEYYYRVYDEIVHPPGTNWLDVAELDFSNQSLIDELADTLIYWVNDYNVDGFRCDYASGIPVNAWRQMRETVNEVKPDVFMLAEDDTKYDWFLDTFNSNYGGWPLLHILVDIKNEKANSDTLKNYLISSNKKYNKGTFPLNFTTNHDINSWEGTLRGRLGNAYEMFSMLTFTLPGMPLLYSGQESSVEKQLKFFDKDEIIWNNYNDQPQIEKLIDLKKNNPALYNTNFADSTYFLHCENTNIFSFVRVDENTGNKIVVIVNFSDQIIDSYVQLGSFEGEYTEFEGNETQTLQSTNKFKIMPYGYKIFILD